jgi:acyl-[acyl-carrier-protein]-phospholipid O-acyltransferase/long-chain-fatty-acid--[acyl-carrier-protein] ligase
MGYREAGNISRAGGPLWRIYEGGARLVFKLFFLVFHRVRVEGRENIPATYDKLIVIANHASLVDGLLIWTYLKLPFRIIVDRTVAGKFFYRPFMQNRYTVPIDSMNPYSLKEVIHKVNEGIPLFIFPEGRMTWTGSLMKIYEGTGFAALRTGACILPIHLGNIYKTMYAKKHPGRKFFTPITITVGKMQRPMNLDNLPHNAQKREASRIIYRMLSEVYFEAHNKPSTLGREFIRKCKEHKGKLLYNDGTGKSVTYWKTLVGAFALGRCLSRHGEQNIGVMLPNLTVTALIFIGLQLFRKTPVFLNYSSGPGALGHAMELADLKVIITSRQFLERIRLSKAVFEGRDVVFLEDLKEQVGMADKLYGLVRAFFSTGYKELLPGECRETACILFTSGSEGLPKGVCLSHENIISNVYQALSRIDVRTSDYFLNALPIFHSFGLMFGIIIPVFAGVKSFLYVSPLHYRVVPEVAYEQGCTIFCGTNTFLNGYAKKANPYDFYSMRYIFCGAEALSESVFDKYAKTFGIRVMSGYGATECSPIVCINSALEHEYGTVGMVLPGMEYKVLPVEGIDHKGGTSGKLYVRGKNVMKGYLKNEKANRKYLVEDEGWYDTGDIVEITEGGFVKIVGRLKRFAKISGEMISLTALEAALAGEFGDRKDVAVMAIPDEHKGERLVLVTNSRHADMKSLREIIRSKGFSDLACPRDIHFLKEIPKLGTGKVDYVKLKDMI